jgi:hypothetical protein
VTIFGWDMSHFDAPGIGTALAEGISFMTHKAGGDANDTEIGAWWEGVRDDATAGRLIVGAYWVLYPGSPSTRADAFIARLDSQCPGWRTVPFILQADCEKWNGDASTVPGKAYITAFCDRLVLRMPKLRPIVYAPKWVYGDSLKGLGYPLWASAYVTGSGGFKALYPGDGSSRWATYSGQTPAILQYTSSATIGGQTTCDANAFRGTPTQLKQLLAPGWSAVATLDSDDKTYIKGLFDTYLGFDAPQSDGTPTSRIGRLVLTQGIPDGAAPDNRRALAYQVLQNLGALAATVPTAAQNADAVLSALGSADLDEAAAALRAVLGAVRAAQLGALLQA